MMKFSANKVTNMMSSDTPPIEVVEATLLCWRFVEETCIAISPLAIAANVQICSLLYMDAGEVIAHSDIVIVANLNSRRSTAVRGDS